MKFTAGCSFFVPQAAIQLASCSDLDIFIHVITVWLDAARLFITVGCSHWLQVFYI